MCREDIIARIVRMSCATVVTSPPNDIRNDILTMGAPVCCEVCREDIICISIL